MKKKPRSAKVEDSISHKDYTSIMREVHAHIRYSDAELRRVINELENRFNSKIQNVHLDVNRKASLNLNYELADSVIDIIIKRLSPTQDEQELD